MKNTAKEASKEPMVKGAAKVGSEDQARKKKLSKLLFLRSTNNMAMAQ